MGSIAMTTGWLPSGSLYAPSTDPPASSMAALSSDAARLLPSSRDSPGSRPRVLGFALRSRFFAAFFAGIVNTPGSAANTLLPAQPSQGIVSRTGTATHPLKNRLWWQGWSFLVGGQWHVNRRNFLKVAGTASTQALFAARLHAAEKSGEPSGPGILLRPQAEEPQKPVAANDHIQIALIGAGGQGQYDTRVAASVPGVKVVAAADCYDGRLTHSKELWGQDIQTTRDYREILARKDVDAVVIGTPDHWHRQASIDAMHAGKDVYCEKPMIHLYSDGPAMIEASKSTGRILQIGSQRVSNILYIKAKELLASGAIGKLNMVSAFWDRNSSIGAWNYTVPPDASPETCDWAHFLGNAAKMPFSGEHFCQWRKWKAYGSGVAGDLFVHLFSGTHFITGA